MADETITLVVNEDITTIQVKEDLGMIIKYPAEVGPSGPTGPTGETGPIGPQGDSLEYDWDGTELGIRVEGDSSYTYTDLEGPTGPTGPQGEVGVDWQGPWSAGTYTEDQGVSNNGSSFIANKETTEEPSLTATDWDLLARKGEDGEGSGDVIGPDSSTIYNIAVFDDGTGKIISDSGVGIDSLVNSLDDLNDTDVTNPSDGQVLTYNTGTGNWEAQDSSGGSLDELSDVSISSVSEYEMLKYNGTNWVNEFPVDYLEVYNNSGATISQGLFVEVVNSFGEIPAVEVADKSSSEEVSGFTLEDIVNGGTGLIKVNGHLQESFINTDGMAAGGFIWLDTAGGFTDVEPTTGNVIKLGKVVVVASSNGSLFIDCPARIIPEGYTDDDVDAHLSGGTGISYTAGEITNTDTGSSAVSSHTTTYNHDNFLTDITNESLADLSDVTGASDAIGKVLTLNSSFVWEAQYVDSGAKTLDGLDDVDAGSPTDGQVITYNDSTGNWENSDVPAPDLLSDIGNVDIAGLGDGGMLVWDLVNSKWVVQDVPSGGATTLDGLNDVSASSPSDNDVLTYNSTSGDWESQAAQGGSSDIIEEGDSSVEVVDTGTGYISMNVDGSEKARYYDSNPILRIGNDFSTVLNGSPSVIVQRDDVRASIGAICSNDASNYDGQFLIGKTRGSTSSMTAVQDGDRIGALNFAGASSTSRLEFSASIFAYVDGTVDVGNLVVPMRLEFETSPDNSGNRTSRLIVRADGTVHPGADDSQDFGSSSLRWTDIYATNATIQTSDKRMKEDIFNSDLGLDFITKLKPVSFKWKDHTISGTSIREDKGDEKVNWTKEIKHNRKHYGLLAQEVKDALAEVNVHTDDFAGYIVGDDGRLGLRYGEFIGPIIKSVQELSNKVDELEQENKDLKARLERLEKALLKEEN